MNLLPRDQRPRHDGGRGHARPRADSPRRTTGRDARPRPDRGGGVMQALRYAIEEAARQPVARAAVGVALDGHHHHRALRARRLPAASRRILSRLAAEWRRGAEMSVFLADDVSDTDRRAIEAAAGAGSGRGELRVRVEGRRAGALQADVRRSRAHGGCARRPIRCQRPTKCGCSRRASGEAVEGLAVKLRADARCRRCPVRPAVARPLAVVGRPRPPHRLGARRRSHAGRGVDGRQCRPPRPVRPSRRD